MKNSKVKTLLTEQNSKTSKGVKRGYLTAILYMAPANTVSGINVCPMATKGCKAACLYTAGRGKFSNVQAARIKKTELFRDDRAEFFKILEQDILRFERRAKRLGLKLAIRLNGTSDIAWENFAYFGGKNIFERFSKIQFYDYTKNIKRLFNTVYKNYHITLSASETMSNALIKLTVTQDKNVAVVFENELPKTFLGLKVINGDRDDLRFKDRSGVVVGLLAKGDAKHDTSGFVRAA